MSRTWTIADLAELRRLYWQRRPVREIAAWFDRSERAIYVAACKLGLRKGGRCWRPIGSERVRSDGVRERKVSDTNSPRDWKAVHILEWEAKNGPAPRGALITAGQECVTRADIMRQNMWHNYPQPLGRLIQLRGALQRQINKRARP